MPNRFRPQFGPPPRRPFTMGEEVARGLESFMVARDRAEARERDARGHERSEVQAELAFQELLQGQGLREADTPAEMRDTAEARRASEPDFRSRDLFEDRGVGMADRQNTRRDIFSPQFESVRPDPMDVFGGIAEAGPERMDRPVLLPGQFNPEAGGFSPRTVWFEELEHPTPVAERHPPREVIAGREFERIGPDAATQRQIMAQEEIGRLMEGGVPPETAPFAQRDDPLMRAWLGPTQERDQPFSEEDLVAAGYSPELARIAARDAPLARRLIEHALGIGPDRGPDVGLMRFEREVALDNLRQVVAQLVGRGADLRAVVEGVMSIPEFSDRGIVNRAHIESEFNRARRLMEQERAPSDRTIERRRNIVSTFNRLRIPLTDPVAQDVVDLLSGVGPEGGDMEPMTPEQIRRGYQEGGAPPEVMRQIENMLRTFELSQPRR
jgi:hypothetical protein